MYSNIIFFTIILSLFLGDLLIYTGLLNMFFEDRETIWAGIIAFIGAIIGGAITYYGVRLQIHHREKEMFLGTASESLKKMNILINSLKPIYNHFFLIKHSSDDENVKKSQAQSYVKEFDKNLTEHKDIVYEYLDYETVELIDFFQKSLFIRIDNSLDYPKVQKDMEHLEEIYNMILGEKIIIEEKYRHYKNIK